MYSTCLFCKAPLGRNETLEEFPVGRRVAFDAARGRLWAVCRTCERWNLSPIEERWEAMEECERIFRDTRLQVSTDNIGLARLKEGLELVRVGTPQRPEMAAWRYGDQFGRRRTRAMVQAGLGLTVAGAVVAGGAAVGVTIGAFAGSLGPIYERIVKGSPKTVVATITGAGGAPVEVRRSEAARTRLIATEDRLDWRLEVKTAKQDLVYAGDAAVRAAAQILPGLNRYGGNRRQVSDAVGFLEEAGSVEKTFGNATRLTEANAKQTIEKLPYGVRLALEMAAHEEAERRALEGELAELERAWREAEEIAAISDSLLVPSTIDDWIRRVRGH